MDFRLQKLVKGKIAAWNAHWLARDIFAKTGKRISRRTLAKIATNPAHVSFKLRMLEMLDDYFTADGKGEGLREAPIFVQPGLIECLIRPEPVTFLLAAKPLLPAQTYFITRWDTRSLTEVLRQMSEEARSRGTDMRFEIEDVILREPVDLKNLSGEKWCQLVEDDEQSLVALGSPHALLASELMLAKMFNVTPFVSPPGGSGFGGRIPFYFAWPRNHWDRPSSAFALDWRNVDSRNLRDRLEQSKIWAFVMGKDVHIEEVDRDVWKMYGTIAAQRRMRGHIWMVISGLTGPATYAGARLLKDIKAELPWPKRGQHGDVLWQPFEAVITNDPAREKVAVDVREYRSVKPLGEPRVWRAQEAKPKSDEP